MTDYIITIHVKEKNLIKVVSMIGSESEYCGGLIESIEWEKSK